MRYAAIVHKDYYPCGFEGDILSLHSEVAEANEAIGSCIAESGPKDNAYVYDWEMQKKIDVDQNPYLRCVAFADFREDGRAGKSGVREILGVKQFSYYAGRIGTRRGGFLRFYEYCHHDKPLGLYNAERHPFSTDALSEVAKKHFESGRIFATDGSSFDQIRVWVWGGGTVRVDLCEVGKKMHAWLGEMTSQIDIPCPEVIDRSDVEAVQRLVADHLGIEKWDRIIVDG